MKSLPLARLNPPVLATSYSAANTWKLSADGSTLTDYYREFESDGSTLSLDYVCQRTGEGSAFAADWQSIKETRNAPLLMEVKAYEGDGLSFISPSEQRTQNVKFDSKEYLSERRARSGHLDPTGGRVQSGNHP